MGRDDSSNSNSFEIEDKLFFICEKSYYFSESFSKFVFMKRLILLISILALVASCAKSKYKRDCCTGSMRIFTEGFNNTDSVYVAAPNAFTPNGDGINDVFTLFLKGYDLSTASLSIRKKSGSFIDGQEMFNGYEGNIVWDGTDLNGKLASPGVYTFEFAAITNDFTFIQGEGEFCVIEYDYTNSIKNCSSCYFGDQFDPTTHNFTYETNESFVCD